MTTELQMTLSITDNAKLVSIYGDKYVTIIEDNLLYLINSTVISKYNAIASIDIAGNCAIYDRDKANCFVDWSHEHYGKRGQIDELPESQIKTYLATYLHEDTYSLIQFNHKQLDGKFKQLLDRFDSDSRMSLLAALSDSGLYNDIAGVFKPYTYLTSKDQMQWAHDNMYSFIFINATTQKYDCCRRIADGKYEVIAKNGSCGSWTKVCKDLENCCCIIFNEKPASGVELSEDVEKQILEDMESSAYHAANKFIKLEEAFNKELDAFVLDVTESKGFVDLEKIHRPDVEVYAETIAKEIRAYKREHDSLLRKEACKAALVKAYHSAYTELTKAQDSLKALRDSLK